MNGRSARREWISRLDQRWYPDCADNWDDELFRNRIAIHINRETRVLDLGAGAGLVTQMNFRGLAAHVAGIDLDERVMANPFLDEAHLGTAENLPFQSASFDVVFSDNVLEHLPDPVAAFREVARVLRPGGRFLAKTPNKWHYMPLIARLTPHGFHRFYNRLRGRAGEDTFRTLYRANSRRDVARLASQSGLRVERLELIERRPEYLRLHPATYVLGRAYEALVNSTEALAAFRILLVAELSKPAEARA